MALSGNRKMMLVGSSADVHETVGRVELLMVGDDWSLQVIASLPETGATKSVLNYDGTLVATEIGETISVWKLQKNKLVKLVTHKSDKGAIKNMHFEAGAFYVLTATYLWEYGLLDGSKRLEEIGPEVDFFITAYSCDNQLTAQLFADTDELNSTFGLRLYSKVTRKDFFNSI